MSSRIDAIRARKLHGLSPGEQVKVAALTATAATRQGTRVGRAADAAATRIWVQAERRVQAEEAAVAGLAAKKIQDKAAAKAAAKAARKGWW
jgi:hypothetical protein